MGEPILAVFAVGCVWYPCICYNMTMRNKNEPIIPGCIGDGGLGDSNISLVWNHRMPMNILHYHPSMRSNNVNTDNMNTTNHDFTKLLYFGKSIRCGEVNHILIGNGFNLELGYNTSYAEILKILSTIDPESYGIAKNLQRYGKGFDVDEFMALWCPLGQRTILEDFYYALIYIINGAELHREKTAGILYNFNSVFTLNLDPFLNMVYADMVMSNQLTEVDRSTLKKIREILRKTGCARPYHQMSMTQRLIANAFLNDENFNLLVEIQKREERRSPIVSTNRVLLPDDGFVPSGINRNEYVWKGGSQKQTVFYPHGATPLFTYGDETFKLMSSNARFLNHARVSLDRARTSFLGVMGHDSAVKMKQIENNAYLSFCYDSLRSIKGNIYIFGVNFIEKTLDSHIWDAINLNKDIEHVYIALYFDKQKYGTITNMLNKANERRGILLKNKDKVFFCDTNLDF